MELWVALKLKNAVKLGVCKIMSMKVVVVVIPKNHYFMRWCQCTQFLIITTLFASRVKIPRHSEAKFVA